MRFLAELFKKLFSTSSPAGTVSLKDVEKVLFLIVISLASGTTIDVGVDEIAHYTQVAAPENVGKSFSLTILVIVTEFLRRKGMDNGQQPTQLLDKNPRKK